MDDLEIIKENVQPLRQGRKIDELKAALTHDINENDNRREMIRQKFENDIKQSKNDDEIFETYYKYINWIQQNYPGGGIKIKFAEILEKCIETFYKNEKYQNDERMLSIFLIYTNLVTTPIQFFKVVFKQNFGKKLSRFYIEWSYHLEMQHKYKKAIQVIKIGIENGAEPLSSLTRTLNDLEVRTMRF
ncbi:mitotic checkpoint serine/threonine-protein kinase BUB1 beta-like, partial [Euroglyphus maynei]